MVSKFSESLRPSLFGMRDMGYLYENSNPERFQHLSQSLLTSDFPSLQCFPIGQPDGGRDGWDPDTRTVLQVKFKRADEEENADWIINALQGELPKINRLAEKGANKYILVTNARGTAHEGGGRIDRVQKWMNENLPIEGICFWRDEIDRRFDQASPSLKLKYSEILSFEDGLEIALSAVLGHDKERQKDTIRAFIDSQFKADQTVKFKQVSLSNNLLDLFIDVPLGIPQNNLRKQAKGSAKENLRAYLESISGVTSSKYLDSNLDQHKMLIEANSGILRKLNLGAAQALLSNEAQEHLKLVVLEGAPGQGKSTLAQFVCQMHRARFLQKSDIFAQISENYHNFAFRVPIKIDLRDYAAFLEGSSPFESSGAPTEPQTLDVFLAQLISFNSGGLPFTAYDVVSLLKNAPVLLFLDGLDEVADITARESLVNSIGEALSRWRLYDADLQAVVTSRPSVFGSAPSFDKYGFSTLSLQNINDKRIEEYADKWVIARNLDSIERKEVKKILAEKLELAHIRDLTRNPMQLTILLSLIHQVGHSLPDQRTDLYGRYVDLFLTREADKSAQVREHRPILLGFIQYLAWILQTQAESSKSSGSIAKDKLQDLARKYLEDGQQKVAIAEDLFGGGLERIFVLVERIEGQYEFEVQPLREFYCAQYLYSTAHVGTYRDEVLRGDRAQRFEALAANPFWLNVCRFYAGSCERGETGTLVLSLEEMISSANVALSMHARRVGLSLLQDRVFSNVKYAQDKLIRAVVDGVGITLLSNGIGAIPDELALDVECGRDTLRDLLFQELKEAPYGNRAHVYCTILRANGGSDLSSEFIHLVRSERGEKRTRQLIRMFLSGACKNSNSLEIWHLITEDTPSDGQLLARCNELLNHYPDLAASIPELVNRVLEGALSGKSKGNYFGLHTMNAFTSIISNPEFALNRLSHLENRIPSGSIQKPNEIDKTPAAVREFVLETVSSSQDRIISSRDNGNMFEFWNMIVENLRKRFGESWASMSLSIKAAGDKPTSELPSGAENLFDPEIPLCARTRSARLRRGGTRWWIEQHALAQTTLDQMLWVGIVLMWSSVENIFAMKKLINQTIDSLEEDQFTTIKKALVTSTARKMRIDKKKTERLNLNGFSPRVAVLLTVVFKAESSRIQTTTQQERQDPSRKFLSVRRQIERIRVLPSEKNEQEYLSWARMVVSLEKEGANIGYEVFNHLMSGRIRETLREQVLRDPLEYPLELVAKAIASAQRQYRAKALSVVAKQQDWVFD